MAAGRAARASTTTTAPPVARGWGMPWKAPSTPSGRSPIVPGTREFFAADDLTESHPGAPPPALAAALRDYLQRPAVAYKPRAAPPSNREALRAI